MKQLFGSELAGYIKARQAKQARQLVQSYGVQPKLAIVASSDNPTITTYVNLKKRYGADIGVLVDEHFVDQVDLADAIEHLNTDKSVQGIIVQLPLADKSATDDILAKIDKNKDVDGLAPDTPFDPATPMAINWLLSGYDVALEGKKICIVGSGKLVGAPLASMWKSAGLDVTALDKGTPQKDKIISDSDVIVTAVGQPGLITSSMIKTGAVVIDAGVASEKGVMRGDVADDVYERLDISITPKKGGVGPLTVCALFDNLLRASFKISQK